MRPAWEGALWSGFDALSTVRGLNLRAVLAVRARWGAAASDPEEEALPEVERQVGVEDPLRRGLDVVGHPVELHLA